MPKSGISSFANDNRGASGKLEVVRFIGLSLAGGKTDKACLSVLEYYPSQKRIFLSKIFEKIKSEPSLSSDLKIHEIILQHEDNTQFLAVDVPWSLPLCLTCELPCPGYEICKEEHIRWMWSWTDKVQPKKKPKKLFTPYTQRAVEMYLATELEEKFTLSHVMGSNSAPLVARAAFILRRVNIPRIEVYPKLTLWRLGTRLGILKSHLRTHRHAISGSDSRRSILKALEEKNLAFVYEQDRKTMIANSHAFDSFLCAYTGFLKYLGQTVDRPDNFPAKESWIEFPK